MIKTKIVDPTTGESRERRRSSVFGTRSGSIMKIFGSGNTKGEQEDTGAGGGEAVVEGERGA